MPLTQPIPYSQTSVANEEEIFTMEAFYNSKTWSMYHLIMKNRRVESTTVTRRIPSIKSTIDSKTKKDNPQQSDQLIFDFEL